MERQTIENITAVIEYIEAHLNENPDLDRIADAVHYSKYHLHRMFTDTVGMTIHDYVRRRQLTEAAKLLVFSKRPVLEIAQIAGYDSQQAFTTVFKSMYKRTPVQYRENEEFYPLQLKFALHKNICRPDAGVRNISYAVLEDIPDWMDFVRQVIDGFPGLEETEHLERLRQYIEHGQALVMRDGDIIIGAAAFSFEEGSIDFLGVHPQYRHHGIAKAFLDFLMERIFSDREISITTFREGDKADTGQRAQYRGLGFAEGELLTEFGYPTQRLVLTPAGYGQEPQLQEEGESADE